MRFVDGDERHADTAQHGQAGPCRQPFGGDVEELQPSVMQRVPYGVGLFFGIAGGERAGLDAGGPQGADLVAHQGNERRDHHGHAVAHQCRKLEAERFAAAGGHDGQNVVA